MRGLEKERYDNALDVIALLAGDIGPLRRLVFAARKVAFEDQGPEAIKELDEASEAFAHIPWDDEPTTAHR